jgi:hypothetical protein
VLGDTWLFDGADWRQATADVAPPARTQAARPTTRVEG